MPPSSDIERTSERGRTPIEASRPWILLGVALLIACAQHARAAASDVDTSSPGLMKTSEGSMDPALQQLVDVAIDDLANRLAIGRDGIAVSEVRRVIWPDRSLGCPRPGMNYPQVQQDGLLIRLRAHGREYSYHSGGTRPPFLCENAA
jgi:hypothetical protein